MDSSTLCDLIETCARCEIQPDDNHMGTDQTTSPDGKWLLVRYEQEKYPSMVTGIQLYRMSEAHVNHWYGHMSTNQEEYEKDCNYGAMVTIDHYPSLSRGLWLQDPVEVSKQVQEDDCFNPFVPDFCLDLQMELPVEVCEKCYGGFTFEWIKGGPEPAAVGRSALRKLRLDPEAPAIPPQEAPDNAWLRITHDSGSQNNDKQQQEEFVSVGEMPALVEALFSPWQMSRNHALPRPIIQLIASYVVTLENFHMLPKWNWIEADKCPCRRENHGHERETAMCFVEEITDDSGLDEQEYEANED